MTFSLATINLHGRATPVLKIAEDFYSIVDVAPALIERNPSQGLMNIFEDWETSEAALIALADQIRNGTAKAKPLSVTLEQEHFLCPLRYPRKVVAMGANYYDHMFNDAGMTDYRKENSVATMFLKPPTTTLVGAGRSVRYPTQSEKFDWEIELCAIVGKRAKRVRAQDARSVIAGFTIGMDLSARDWQLHPRHPFKFDLFGGKGFDDSCPLGPWIVPARYVDDRNLRMRLSLNGELKQDGNTRDMIWSLDEQIEEFTKHVTLEPGDVIMTGTPAGVGLPKGTFMKVGDRLEAEIEGIGSLHVEIGNDQNDPLVVVQ